MALNQENMGRKGEGEFGKGSKLAESHLLYHSFSKIGLVKLKKTTGESGLS
jgi:hypothetical protein